MTHAQQPGKEQLVFHEDAAFNAETPVHLLNDRITPTPLVFVRNNGSIEGVDFDPDRWRLTIDGEVRRPFAMTIPELKQRFPLFEITAVMECAGNGRSFLDAPTDGVPWGLGAVACLRFQGFRLADLLAHAGLTETAVYVGHMSADVTRAGRPALSRGLPVAKAVEPETLVAIGMNGEPLPPIHGGPMRIVAPGYPGSAWQKWLSRLWIRDREHDGARMTGLDYRLPRRPMTPGETPDPADFEVITSMPPRALITSHAAGSVVPAGQQVRLEGWVWGHGRDVARVDVSADGGDTFAPAELEPASGSRFAWRRFSATVTAPATPGAFVVLPRAALADGDMQPVGPAQWNPKGYCNNGCQRLELRAG